MSKPRASLAKTGTRHARIDKTISFRGLLKTLQAKRMRLYPHLLILNRKPFFYRGSLSLATPSLLANEDIPILMRIPASPQLKIKIKSQTGGPIRCPGMCTKSRRKNSFLRD